MSFVHLHNHTEYSLLDGFTHVEDMVRRAADLGMPAVAITDHGVMSGVVELADACDKVKKDTGKWVKPIFGCEVYFVPDEDMREDIHVRPYHLLLLAKTDEGYHNLLKLCSESHVDHFYYKPRTSYSMLKKYGHGIIASSACIAGIIPVLLDQIHVADFENTPQFAEAVAWAKKLAACFDEGDFYIELQNQGITTDKGQHTQTELNRMLAKVAERIGAQTIATNDFHYLLREDAKAQDIMLCIGTGKTINEPGRMKFANDEFYMKTEEEMREALKEFPESCDNTVTLAEKCNVTLERDSILPKFPLPEGETEVSYFRKLCEEGMRRRYGDPVPQDKWERYEYEADIIIKQGFPAYFLIVQEYIDWARSQGIGVGPGRGSAAGAIVAYALGITDIEPISNGLMFERFLSPERVEMPDIDCDFAQARREEVIQHIKDIYGEDHVSQVITFGTLKAKNAVRDAARVLDYPYAVGDRIAKYIGNEINITIDKALKANPDFKKAYNAEPDIKAVVDAAKSIEGHIRGEGVHACATIICRDPMSDHVPMKRDTKGGGIITQYDGHYTPELGLLKMDFLGLRNLDVLIDACANVKQRFGIDIDPNAIPIDDKAAFALIASGNTDGLFQVESALYVSLFNRIPPHNFSDIVASIALNRPGPLESGMVEDYVEVVQGKKPMHLYDERLKPVLQETYGTMVYQEQVMQVSMIMSGFSAGKADKLRKAMGKKKIDIMQELKPDWDNGAVANGYSLKTAQEIWADAEKFAEYAFNKSHSAAYAVLVMRTAYMKAHYPMEFMAAVLTSFMESNEKLIRYIASCNQNGTPVLPPDINISNADFTPTDTGIRFGLTGIRGVGRGVAQSIVDERVANGPYTSLHNFINRLDSKSCNRRVLESLIKSGAFDSTGYTRRQLMYFVDETNLLEAAAKHQREKDRGLVSMFDMFGDMDDMGFKEDIPAPDGIEWPQRQLLSYEKEIMNTYISDHPLRPYAATIARSSRFRMGDLLERTRDIQEGTFIGMVVGVVPKRTKTGKEMAIFELEDMSGRVSCVSFKYADARDIIVEDKVIKIRGRFEVSENRRQIIADEVSIVNLPDSAQEPVSRPLEITLSSSDLDQVKSAQMNELLKRFPGLDAVVMLVYQKDGRKFRAELPLTVDGKNEVLRREIRAIFGKNVC